MAPGYTNTKTLTVNHCAQAVTVVRTEAGPNTGDTYYTLETAEGRRSRWFSDPGVTSIPTDPSTGDQWGTLG